MLEQLGINLGGLLTQLVSIIILGVVLYMVLHKPITQALNKRSERIRESLEAADKALQDVADSAQKTEKEMQKVRSEGQRIISEAREAAEKLQDREAKAVSKRTEEMIAQAQAQIKRERDAAFEELRNRFSDLAIIAAEQVVRKALDKETHENLIDSMLKDALQEVDSK